MLERADHGEHLGHILGGTGLVRGPLDAQGIRVLVKGIDHAIGQVADGFAVFHGTPDDLVVDIRDVAHIGDAIATDLEPALHHIERHHGPRMPQMAEIVDRHATHIHADMSRLDGGERLNAACQRVVDLQRHCFYLFPACYT